jgi:chemotaxis regulatin CheY-phosphate phosphatase CheZ
MNIVDFAHQIIQMDNTNRELRRENAYLKEVEAEYQQFLASSIQHSNGMMGQLTEILMTPGVFEAVAKQKTQKD